MGLLRWSDSILWPLLILASERHIDDPHKVSFHHSAVSLLVNLDQVLVPPLGSYRHNQPSTGLQLLDQLKINMTRGVKAGFAVSRKPCTPRLNLEWIVSICVLLQWGSHKPSHTTLWPKGQLVTSANSGWWPLCHQNTHRVFGAELSPPLPSK